MATPSSPQDERTYHSTQSSYVLPNDSAEHKRLEETATRLRELFDNKNLHAPLDPSSIHRIVEVGCGTGIVTDELGATFPSAKVYGVDLSAVPGLRPKRGNVEFIQGDFLEIAATEKDERLERGTFDYVFSRALMGGVTDWGKYIDLCLALAKPGAWLEMQEPDFTAHLSPPPSGNPYEAYSHTPSIEDLEAESRSESVNEHLNSWRTAYNTLLRALNLEPRIGALLASHFQRAGLQDIHVKRYALPFGTWDSMTDVQRRFAPVHKAFVRDDAPGSIRKLARATGVLSGEEVDEAVERTKVFLDGFEGNGEFAWYYVVCGRKAQAG